MALDLKELQDIVKNTVTKYILLSGTGIAKNDAEVIGTAPFKKWRVRAWGFLVLLGAASGENPVVQFGSQDVDGVDNDVFGTLTMDANAAKHFATGDTYAYDPDGLLEPSVLLREGTHVYGAGDAQLNVWQTTVQTLRVRRPNDHQLSVYPYMLLEVKIK